MTPTAVLLQKPRDWGRAASKDSDARPRSGPGALKPARDPGAGKRSLNLQPAGFPLPEAASGLASRGQELVAEARDGGGAPTCPVALGVWGASGAWPPGGEGAQIGSSGGSIGAQGAGRGQAEGRKMKRRERGRFAQLSRTPTRLPAPNRGHQRGDGGGRGNLKTHLTAGRSLRESAPNPRGGGLGEVLGGVSDWQPGSVFQTRKKKKIPCPLGRFLSHFSPAGSCCLLGPPGIGRVKIL